MQLIWKDIALSISVIVIRTGIFVSILLKKKNSKAHKFKTKTNAEMVVEWGLLFNIAQACILFLSHPPPVLLKHIVILAFEM